MMKHLLLPLVGLLAISGCASKFIVQSNPSEAEIYVNSPNVSDRVLLGKTPLATTVKEVTAKTGVNPTAGEYIEITLEKKGFRTERILVPASRLQTFQTNINIALQNAPSDSEKAGLLVQLLFNAQKFAQKHDYELAISEINKALEFDSKFVRALAIKGAIYYLRRDYNESLKWYEQVLTLDPKDDEALKMVVEIRKLANVGKPQQ